MYYIVNHTQHIIAADNSLLELLSLESIDELYTQIALGDIKFTTSNDDVTITTTGETHSYQIKNHTLSGMLGDITLIEVYPSEETTESVKDEISIIDDEPITFSDPIQEEAETVEEKISFDDEPFDLMPEVIEVEEKTDDKISFDDEPFDLISDTEETITEEVTTTETEDDTSPIVIDAESISQDIGISTDDYNNFLNEYIDTALTLEKDLGSEEETRSNAISTLSHLSNVLHLPIVTNIIEQIKATSSDSQNTLIKSLYATLARLTTTQTEVIEKVTTETIENIAEETIAETQEEKPNIETSISSESFGTIDLSDVQPIHFDFQMEAAANDLSLPVELIEEFVNDFIEQAHTETDKMLEYYEKGDLDAIQKIGHLLKGTASNLRINPLADTLYEIQFCEDSNNLEKLIKEYWGHFLAFETQINLSSK